MERDTETMNILRLNNESVVNDLMLLLDHKDYWDALDSIYGEIDIITQYLYCLNKKCENEQLNKNLLMRIAAPFRFFVVHVVDEFVTIKEFRNIMEKLIQHKNRDAFLKFIESIYINRKTMIRKLYATRDLLQPDVANILDDISITRCNTGMKFRDEQIDISFVLLRISDITYQCTINDIKFLIDRLNNAIECGDNVD